MAYLLNYKFHDTPDDRDCFMKTFYLGKKAFHVGMVFAVGDVLLTRENRTTMQKALKFPKYIIPLVGASTAFTVTMHLATRALPWDHKFHYMLGGLAAAGVLGHFAKSGVVAFNTSVFLGGVAFLYQHFREEREYYFGDVREGMFTFSKPKDWEYFLQERRLSGNWLTNDHDYRIFTKKERDRTIEYIDSF